MNSRKDYFRIIVVICFGLFLASCAMGVAMNAGKKWLDSKNDRPEINISGIWASPEWGAVILKQEKKDIVGVVGDYPVRGVVSGNSIYLLMLYKDDSVHYFAELKASDNNTFKGFYSKYGIVDEVKKEPWYLNAMSIRFISALP
jgi:hypothetical protein